MKMQYWVRANPSDFGGTLPRPRSGHTAVSIGKSKIVVFGGLVDKNFLTDIAVYDIDNKLWFQPECTGSDTDGQVGPCARAFHVAVSIDCHLFIFGGRSGNNRLGDFWVLDTDIWQWSELTSFGDLPSPRDFSAASAIGNRKIVMYGGYDGKKWLSDVYVLDTISLEWTELSVSGTLPSQRCGHTATMVEKRLLVYGGRGGGGSMMSDLWALKGLIEEEKESPGWTQLKLPGQAPSARSGHTVTSGGHYLLLFGGHGTGGWLSKYDVYHNDCIVLDRVTAQWRRLPTNNELPAARAYHSMTSIGSRHLLFGGFDGKSTYDDFWWLVPEEDPISKRSIPIPPKVVSKNKESSSAKEGQTDESSIAELHKRLGISLPNHKQILDESEDIEFIDLRKQLVGEGKFSDAQVIQELRDHWSKCLPRAIAFKELSPLLRDYQRLVNRHHMEKVRSSANSEVSGLQGEESFRFYHMKNSSELRLDDIPQLLGEYNQLVLDTYK